MSSLQISRPQASALAGDMVRRHAQTLGRQTDARLGASGPLPAHPAGDAAARAAAGAAAGSAGDAARLAALHEVMQANLVRDTGALAVYLAVDMNHAAHQLARALQAGAVYREPAAAALMSAAAALGARWLGDERLCVGPAPDGPADGPADPLVALPEPGSAEALRDWAEAAWSARFQRAALRARALERPTRYALGRARAFDFSSESLRSVADAVFQPGEVEALTRFLNEERALLAAARLDGRSLSDPRIERLCIAADLSFGLGRFVRLAVARRTGQAETPLSTDALYTHLREALHALAEDPEQ